MRRVEFLINQIRKNANVDSTRYNDDMICSILTEAQSEIRDIIFLANNDSNILKDIHYIDIQGGTRECALPERMFAENSIYSVGFRNQNYDTEVYYPAKRINIKDFANEFGYCVFGKKLLISTRSIDPEIRRVKIIYNSQLPILQIRRGLVSAVVGNNITLTSPKEGLDGYSDFCCFVDASGELVKSDVKIVSYDSLTGVLVVDNATGITSGLYALAGGYSTTNSKLPIEVEHFLVKASERRIAAMDSSQSDLQITGMLTGEERELVLSKFQKSSEDLIYPTISNDTPWI